MQIYPQHNNDSEKGSLRIKIRKSQVERAELLNFHFDDISITLPAKYILI